MKRYVRNIALDQIDIEGQEKLNNSNVLVIGAGGLGCHLLYHIASLGFKNVIIMDADTVSISNLQRQILFNEKSVGKNKAIEAIKSLKKYNSEINYYPIEEMFTSFSQVKEIFNEKVDLIFDCTDNFASRLNISQESQNNNNIPVVFASVSEFQGWIFPQFYKETSDIKIENIFKENENDKNCDSTGVASPSVAFVSSIQAMEGLKFIIGLESIYNKFLNVNCFTYQVTEMEF